MLLKMTSALSRERWGSNTWNIWVSNTTTAKIVMGCFTNDKDKYDKVEGKVSNK